MDASALSSVNGMSGFSPAVMQAKSAMTATGANASAPQQAANMTGTAQAPNMAKIEKSAKEFEGMFVSEMLSHMFEGLEVDKEFGGGHGEEMFRSMMVSEYGKEIANGPGIGISGQIKAMMIQMQEQS